MPLCSKNIYRSTKSSTFETEFDYCSVEQFVNNDNGALSKSAFELDLMRKYSNVKKMSTPCQMAEIKLKFYYNNEFSRIII